MSAPVVPAAGGRLPTAGERWLAAALVLAGAALRFVDLGQQSFWHDEVHSVIMARGSDTGALSETAFNTHGPLYLLMLRGWLHLFGAGEGPVRALSAVIGVLGLVAFHRVVRRYLEPGPALVALALLAASPFHLGYSQEVRGYGLLFATGLLAVEACLVDIERRTSATFAVALVATMATCLSNLSGFFLVGLVGVFAWTMGRPLGYRMRRFVAFALLLGVLLEPWVVSGAEGTGKFHVGGAPSPHSDVILAKGESPPGLASIPYSLYDFTLGRSLGPSVDDLKQHRMRAVWPQLPIVLPALLLALALLVRGEVVARGARRSVLVPWLVIPVLAMALLSSVNLKAANSRYAFLAFAPFVVLVASGIVSIRGRFVRVAAFAALLAVFLVADEQYFTNPYYWKPDARAACALLRREVRPGDAVVGYALQFPLRFYLPDSLVMLLPPDSAFASDAASARWLAANVRPQQRLWVVRCNGWWVDRTDRFPRICAQRRPSEGAWAFEKLPVQRFGPEAPR